MIRALALALLALAACRDDSRNECETGAGPIMTPRDGGYAECDGGARSTSHGTAVAIERGCDVYGYYDGCNYCSATGCTARGCTSDDGGAPTMPEPMCQVIYYALPDPDEGQWVCGHDGYVFHSSCVPPAP